MVLISCFYGLFIDAVMLAAYLALTCLVGQNKASTALDTAFGDSGKNEKGV